MTVKPTAPPGMLSPAEALELPVGFGWCDRKKAKSVVCALRRAKAYILLDRDCLYESISLQDGTIPDPKDAEVLAKVDALLDQIDAALGATA